MKRATSCSLLAGGLLALICILVLLAGGATPDPDPTVVVTLVPATEQPTRLPTEPAASTSPTAMPTAVMIVQPTTTASGVPLTAADQAYVDGFLSISVPMVGVMTDFQSLMTEVGQNPLLLYNDDWITDMAGTLVLWRLHLDDLETLRPTTRFAEVHEHVLEAVGHFRLTIDYTIVGLDEVDADALGLATDHMILAAEAMNAANQALDEVPRP